MRFRSKKNEHSCAFGVKKVAFFVVLCTLVRLIFSDFRLSFLVREGRTKSEKSSFPFFLCLFSKMESAVSSRGLMDDVR